MAVHLTMFDEEVKDDDIVVKMFRSLPSRFKQIMTAIKTLLDVLTMLVADLIGWLKEVQETFEEASMSLQQDRKLYLTEEEWDMRRKKHEGENHFGGDKEAATQVNATLHWVGRQTSPQMIRISTVARWVIGHVSAA
jgi:hypothetical protein